MKRFAPAVVVLIALTALAGAVAKQDASPAAPTEQHRWLQQLVGEWDISTEMSMDDDSEPMRMESTESVRSIGALWTLGEGKTEFGGQPYTSIMTLGYDPAKEAFVGTWVDTMFAYLWHYTGSLDEGRMVLTLEATGPSMGDPAKMANYRDVITIVDSDHRTLTSSVQLDDGTWSTTVRAEFTRRE